MLITILSPLCLSRRLLCLAPSLPQRGPCGGPCKGPGSRSAVSRKVRPGELCSAVGSGSRCLRECASLQSLTGFNESCLEGLHPIKNRTALSISIPRCQAGVARSGSEWRICFGLTGSLY